MQAGSNAVGMPSPRPREKPGAAGSQFAPGFAFRSPIQQRWFGVVALSGLLPHDVLKKPARR